MLAFCEDKNLVISDVSFLANNGNDSNNFTFVSEVHHSVSWLDHCISNVVGHHKIHSMEVLYNCTGSDHLPISMIVQCNHHTVATKTTVNSTNSCLKWSKLCAADINMYRSNTDNYFQRLSIDRDLLLCRNVSCKSSVHKRKIDDLYNNIVNGLVQSSKDFVQIRKHSNRHRPGWNDICKEAYNQKRDAFLMWKDSGKPIFAIYNKSRANFKYALRYCK